MSEKCPRKCCAKSVCAVVLASILSFGIGAAAVLQCPYMVKMACPCACCKDGECCCGKCKCVDCKCKQTKDELKFQVDYLKDFISKSDANRFVIDRAYLTSLVNLMDKSGACSCCPCVNKCPCCCDCKGQCGGDCKCPSCTCQKK